MKRFGYLFTAALLAAPVMFSAESCSPPKARCTAANCAGCCDSLGECQAGNSSNACGAPGATCQACFPGQVCSLGSCFGGNTGQGGGMTGQGGGSGDGGGVGQGGGANTGGGQGGGGPACTAANCPSGCCQGNNCLAPATQTSLACGMGGFACVACGAGFTCTNGSCLPGGTGGGQGGGGGQTCNFTSCPSGCCSGNTCISPAQQNGSGCGQGGSACSPCLSGQTCSNGVCMTSGTGGGGGTGGGAGQGGGTGMGGGTGTGGGSTPTCTAANCGNGCCMGTTCVTAVNQTAARCGNFANACMACPSGNSCINGTCTPPTAAYGSPCTSSSQCASLGGNYTCKLTTSSGNGTYQGGYCTRFCTQQVDCGTGSTCVGLPPSNGEGDALCWDNCSGTDPCRQGYACYGLTNGSACWISPLPPLDAGPPSNKIGNTCQGYSECSNPPDLEWAACITEFNTMGQSTGWPGGYCTAICTTPGQVVCGNNGICLGEFFGTGEDDLCMSRCTGQNTGRGSCRQGYVCSGYFTGLPDGGFTPSTDGFCDRDCRNFGAGCPSGSTCDAGYCL